LATRLQAKVRALSEKDWEGAFLRAQFGKRSQADFVADLVKLLDDGVQIRAAMAFLRDNMKAPQSVVAESILATLEAGAPLADGFVGWFPLAVIESIRAGEAAGDVRGAMASISKMLARDASIAGMVAGELIYPTILVTQGLGVCGYVG